MSRKLSHKFEAPSNRRRNAVVAVGLAVAALTGTACQPRQVVEKGISMERCFDTPQPAVEKVDTQLPPIKLRYSQQGKFFEEDPDMDIAQRTKINASNVAVKGKILNGSGFITTAPDGGEVVVTAAHLLAGTSLQDIQITNVAGKTSSVNNGCYMLENEGAFADPTQALEDAQAAGVKQPTRDIDIAVLRLTEPFGGGLPVAKTPLERSTWLRFTTRKPSGPASYSGLVVTTKPHSLGDMALTGMQPWRIGEFKDDPTKSKQSYIAGPGSSGAAGVNLATNEVACMIYGGAETPDSDESVLTTFNIRAGGATVGEQSGFLPTRTSVMSAAMINLTLSSTKF